MRDLVNPHEGVHFREEFGQLVAEALREAAGNDQRLAGALRGGWFHQNMLRTSTLIQAHHLDSVDERHGRVDAALVEEGGRKVEGMRNGPYTMFVGLFLPTLDRAIRRSARAQTSVDQALVACAIERFRLAEGKLPVALTDLVPRLLDAIPTDVMDGQPLRYAIEPDGGYRRYSVGWNRRDDGGDIVWLESKESGTDLTRGDWVWLMPGR